MSIILGVCMRVLECARDKYYFVCVCVFWSVCVMSVQCTTITCFCWPMCWQQAIAWTGEGEWKNAGHENCVRALERMFQTHVCLSRTPIHATMTSQEIQPKTKLNSVSDIADFTEGGAGSMQNDML